MDPYQLNQLVDHERTIRLVCYLVLFGLMAFWEWKSARRPSRLTKSSRWPGNLLLTALNALVVRLLIPGASLWAADWAMVHQFGLFHWVEVPYAFSVVFVVIYLDWMIYYQHRIFHAYSWLWKIHRVHHTDPEVDATTATRFHTLEAVLSTLFKSVFIVGLGAPSGGVFLFEAILNASLLFAHSNGRIPLVLDRALRWVFVTPDMHRIHHSSASKEYETNFAFIFSFWDHLLKTYRDQPEKSPEKMELGLGYFNTGEYLEGKQILLQPFLDRKGKTAWANLIRRD